MKNSSEVIESINHVIDAAEAISGSGKGKSIVNFDALHAIKHILGRESSWTGISENTSLKRKLKKNV